MERSIKVGKNWEFGIWWREDWKFIGFVEMFGFGKYLGITFKKFEENGLSQQSKRPPEQGGLLLFIYGLVITNYYILLDNEMII